MMGSVLRIAASAACAAVLAGCSMGSMFGGSDDASYANINASQTQVAQAASGALPAIATECPPIRIREGGGGTYEANDLAGNAGGGFVIEPDAGTVLRQGNRE